MNRIDKLHLYKTPFAVIISHELTGVIYSVVFHSRYVRCEPMDGQEINSFLDMKKEMKLVKKNTFGSIFEYSDFRKKMSVSLRHNFLVRNQLIKGGYI